MKDPFKGFDFPSEKEINEATRRAKISETWIAKNKINPGRRSKAIKEAWDKKTVTERKALGQKMRQTKIEKQKGYYVVRSPGNDLLDFYDAKWKQLVDNQTDIKTGLIPPSVVYQIRFVEQYEKNKKAKRIKEILKDYIDLSKYAKLYYQDCEKTMHPYLVDMPHKEWIFYTKGEAYDFVKEQTNHDVDRLPVKQNNGILWTRDKARGWSIIFVEND